MNTKELSAWHRHRKREQAKDLQRAIDAMPEYLAAIREDAAKPDAEADRVELLHTIEAVGSTLTLLTLDREKSLLDYDRPTVTYLERALASLDAAVTSRHVGVHPFGLLFHVATSLGMAIQASHAAIAKSEKATPKHSASTRLRALAIEHRDATTAQVIHMVEAESGGKTDKRSARRVILAARDKKARLR
jgi:hypothetical protein